MAKLIQITASQNDLFGLRRAAQPARRRGARHAEARMRPARRQGPVWGALLLAAGVHGGLGLAQADVPNAGHIAACNRAAHEEVRGRAASPTSKDEAGADAARKAGADTVANPGVIMAATQSTDPQIHGMGGEGAKNAAYRAAYRVCMRQSGF